MFPSSIGQNFSGGIHVWAGSMEDFDNIVRPFYQCNIQSCTSCPSIGQNFSGGMYVWAGSMEDFDNIVRPLSSIPTDTRFFRIRQAQMGTEPLTKKQCQMCYLKKLTCIGTLRQVFYLSDAPSPPMTPYSSPLTHCIRHMGEGWEGRELTRGKIRGADCISMSLYGELVHGQE